MEKLFKTAQKIFLLLFLTLAFTGMVTAGEQSNPEQWVRDAEAVLSHTDCYRAIFHKQERVDGKLLAEETVLFKFRRPFKIYMKWIKDPYKGREILYATGWNENRMKVHDSGITGMIPLDLDPKGSLAMRGNRHPVTDSGLDSLVKLIGDNVRKAIKDKAIEFKDPVEEIVYGCRTQRVEFRSLGDSSKGYYCYRAVLNIDIEKKVPIKVKIYDWDDSLLESYGYEDLKLNANLIDKDFSPQNPDYKF